MSKTNEALSLKSLASGVLEKQKRNKRERDFESCVSSPVSPGPPKMLSQKKSLLQLSSLPDEYEERLAIAEYDGHQTPTQAERIAYLDAFMAVLVTLPYEDTEGDWLGHRVNTAKEWLVDQGIDQPK